LSNAIETLFIKGKIVKDGFLGQHFVVTVPIDELQFSNPFLRRKTKFLT